MLVNLQVSVRIDHEAIADYFDFVDGMMSDMKSDILAMDHIEEVTIKTEVEA